ncbi:MAG: 1-acyl-sn-glycerol-3-phosphate acyltransferase [Prevotellaceae bacterium]|jgi:1-acyl-sn-glycerol-3-phosphate acyltransferase|nr:1-acyl-sn-glycerol-3-phosphate acyltransferase [Prevotellaceae bacterium]
MSDFFIKIFEFFAHRKMFLWLLLAGLAGLLALSALQISFVEDISSFLTNNTEDRRINEAYQHVGAANKIIVTVSPDAKNADEDLLIDAAVHFAEILQESDSAGHIKELIYDIDNEKINEVSGFIIQNLPFFLEEEDYMRIDSLILPQNIEKQLKAAKELLMSPIGGFVRGTILSDPLYFSQSALERLKVFKQNGNYNIDNGFIFNKKGECIVTIVSNYPVSETTNNKLLANEIYNAVNQTVSEFNNEIKIVPFGAALVSITNSDQIKSDSVFAVSIALVLILVLLFYFFRHLKPLFFIAVSVMFGALFSLGVMVLFNSTVSIIAIGISSIILGIAINYPLHFLAHNQHSASVKRTLREIVNPLLIGNITTVGAFLSLMFISSSAMRDLGLFSSLLLVGTILFVLIFLPYFISDTSSHARDKQLIFGKLAEFSPERNKWTVFMFLIFTVALFFFSFGTKFETNLHAINYMTPEQQVEMNKLITENSEKGKILYVVAEGKTAEEALRNYEKNVLTEIVSQVCNGVTISGIGNFFPSEELQKQKIERWNRFWEWNDNISHECSKRDLFNGNLMYLSNKQGFNNGVFDDFTEMINKSHETREFDYFAPIYKNMGENYFSICNNKTLIYTIIQAKSSDDILISSNILASENIFTFDDTSIIQKMVNVLSDDFNNVLYICAFIVFLFLFFSFGRIELALLAFVPLTIGWVWILGLMNIFDLKFNIVNIILATFIFGQGDDYTIFVTEGLIYEYACRKKMLASFKNSIILSATILFIAIGMLIFAKHPAMRSLAELTVVGMISVVMCAYLFPPLIFRFLTVKKGKQREAPWTLWRFFKMTYSFTAFLAGSLVIAIYGFILFGFRKNPSEKNKLRYHRLLHKTADFVIRRVPGVKFHYENLPGETFDKPAVIISNHQSHLDLMCLMMLTPKLIILTNDWAWHSPFYGRIIRYADFYPVSHGIESSIERLAGAVQRGYSIVIFPEGTRSANGGIGRFHRGAFYLAEKLQLDIVPVFLHGAGSVLPKNDFLLRRGQITVQVRERIKPNKTFDYALNAKQIRKYYAETYVEISQKIETLDYFKSFVMNNYIYKGVEVWRRVKKELTETKMPEQINENTVLFKNNGYGVQSFMFALANKNMQVIAVEENEEKTAIAKNCAGIPHNLKIYHTAEWKHTSSL